MFGKPDLIHICRRCGRKLKSVEAQERGMGYVCYKKYLAETNRKKLFTTAFTK